MFASLKNYGVFKSWKHEICNRASRISVAVVNECCFSGWARAFSHGALNGTLSSWRTMKPSKMPWNLLVISQELMISVWHSILHTLSSLDARILLFLIEASKSLSSIPLWEPSYLNLPQFIFLFPCLLACHHLNLSCMPICKTSHVNIFLLSTRGSHPGQQYVCDCNVAEVVWR